MKRNFLATPTKALSVLGFAALFTFSACTEEDPIVPELEEVPATYNFENVDYSGQTARIQMMSMLEAAAKSANDGETVVTADQLDAIFENTNNLFDTDKNIKSKTAAEAVAEIEGYFASIDTLSGTNEYIIGGRLYDQYGVEPAQMIAKGLMGALLYYQATAVYLGEDKMNVDNTEVVEGEGTAMQHHWDEAFGYFGAPDDYLTAEVPEGTEDPTEKAWYWAHYANGRSEVIDLRDEIFNAFLAGRTAINNNDMEARDAAIETIRTNWEKLAATNAVHYVNSALKDLEAGEAGNFYHHWSEGKAFLNALYYNPAKSITNEQLEALNELFGNNPKAAFENPEATEEALQSINVELQEIFGFSDAEIINL
ncbi:DUF4856 domain-containing protein [Nafulsella turpanensis]|uniref:DUF4856 domain-containing protein n=1 Tax=Nafulsella turpanensis TaxID=1265690 RepID=UPI000348863B|nr:DUF4856 domain-containing protein [Nafulsella turpanensis]